MVYTSMYRAFTSRDALDSYKGWFTNMAKQAMMAPQAPVVVYKRSGGASSAMKARLEEAKQALTKARAAAKEKVDAAEGAQLAGAIAGSIAHGALRGYGYSEVMGFDVGIIGAAGALIAAQSLPKGSIQRATLYGVGSGMAAAVASEYAEAFAAKS